MMNKLKKILVLLMIAMIIVSGYSAYSIKMDNVSNVYAARKINKKKNKKAMSAYKKILSKSKYRMDSSCSYRFAVYDINGDGVKELIIDSQCDFYAGQRVDIYTYRNGKAKKLNMRIVWAPTIYDNGLIYSGNAHTGSYQEDFYKIKNGKAKLVSRHYYHDGYNPKTGGIKFTTDKCIVNGKKSNAKKYKKWVKKIKRSRNVRTMYYYNNTESSRNNYLK